jgi:hypothetical protein
MPASPSLLIVPARFKTGKLYTQIATTSAGLVLASSGDFNVTRATTATRFNSAGLIESVASGVPRLDYYTSGGTAGCPALLVEPSAQNTCLQSQDFTTTWSPTNVTVSANVTGTTDPFGTFLAEQLFETTTSGLHFLGQTMSITSGTTYAGSVFFKKAAGSPDWMQLAYSTTGLAGFANFNLTSGTVGNVFAGCTGRIENYGNGWYRCTLIQTATASGTSGGPIPAFINNTNSVTRFVSYAGSTATSIYIFGAQLETGSFATSYIPTTAAAVTRNADVINVTGAVSGCIGQTEGTLYAEIVAQPYNNSSFPAILQVDDNTDGQRFAIFIGPSGGIRVRFNASGVNTNSDSTNPATLVVGQTYKIAAAFGFNGSQALYINGVFQVSGSVTAGPFTAALNRVMLGHRAGIVSPFLIRSAALYTTRLTNTELTALTTL